MGSEALGLIGARGLDLTAKGCDRPVRLPGLYEALASLRRPRRSDRTFPPSAPRSISARGRGWLGEAASVAADPGRDRRAQPTCRHEKARPSQALGTAPASPEWTSRSRLSRRREGSPSRSNRWRPAPKKIWNAQRKRSDGFASYGRSRSRPGRRATRLGRKLARIAEIVELGIIPESAG